ncbi:MAG: hypothetical protein GY850_15440 [bacterium]|nr:hypothetical protein [bacterium]
MSGGIFLIKDDENLVEMTEERYDSEDLLQGLLEKYPNLLAGDQIDSDSPRKWLLISREFGVPDGEGSGGRWSIDHLFIDQDGIPTLVEVKRSSDTRIRREVVGQMLDYAANAVVYWPVETIISKLESRCETISENSDQLIEKLIGQDGDVNEFWTKVKTNLKAGKIRMLFVADEIPSELRRIVEFLNQQMDPAEVLALEIRQFLGEGLKTLVPRVIGQTQEARDKKAALPGKEWDEDSFFDDLINRKGIEEADVARRILAWSKEKTSGIWWGKGRITGSFVPTYDTSNGQHYQLFAVFSSGNIQIYFSAYKNRIEFKDQSRRIEMLEKLNSIPGVNIPSDGISRYPNFSIAVLKDGTALEEFFKIFDWFLDVIR